MLEVSLVYPHFTVYHDIVLCKEEIRIHCGATGDLPVSHKDSVGSSQSRAGWLFVGKQKQKSILSSIFSCPIF